MQTLVRVLTNPENLISYSLGFVAAWFGVGEILGPQDWVTFAPAFLGDGTLALSLVVLHGIILTSCAVLLVFNLYRRIAAFVLTAIFIEVIVGLVLQTGFSPVAVRDIGLCGASLGLALLAARPSPRLS